MPTKRKRKLGKRPRPLRKLKTYPLRTIVESVSEDVATYNSNRNALVNHTSVFSFFSGVGFLDLGFEQAGFEIRYVNELDPSLMHAYRYARKNLGSRAPRYGYFQGDVLDLFNGIHESKCLKQYIAQERKEGHHIAFIGGPPCPDFSIGGKNRGREGKNGRLSSIYVELACQHKPDLFFFENVKGLWRTKKHRRFFEEMKHRLRTSGYMITERLINSIEYGVPQDRERIILIAFRTDFLHDSGLLSSPGTFLENEFPWCSRVIYPQDEIFALPWPTTEPFEPASRTTCPMGVVKEVTVAHWFEKNSVGSHPNQAHYFKPRAGMKRFLEVPEGDDSRKSFKRLHRWRYSPTVCYGNNEVHLHPYEARRITVAEALALQSLPRGFVLPDEMTLSSMFKAVGNGVPFLAAKSIAATIGDFLERGKR